MNILAVDYGTKNIGMAWVDTALGVVLPFGLVKTQDTRNKIQKVIELVKNEKIDKIVVGLPVGLDGKENENTKKVREFVRELKNKIDIPVDFVDERFTSAQADRMGGEASRDEKAAMLILETYVVLQRAGKR